MLCSQRRAQILQGPSDTFLDCCDGQERAHQVRMLSLPVLITDPISCWNHLVVFFLHLGSSPGIESQWLGLSCCGGIRWYEIQLTIFVSSVSTCNVSTQKKGGELLSNKAVVFTVVFLTVATSSMRSFLQALYYSALSDCCSLVAAVSHANTHMRTLSYLNISLLHKCLQKTNFFFTYILLLGSHQRRLFYAPASQQP